jgi:ADP-ribose pyrophosphatase
VDEDGNVVMVRQYRYPVGRVVVEAPAGVVDGSESPEECAQRELQEEIGYAATDITLLGGFWPSPGFCDEFIHAFLARGLEPSRLAADEDENIEVVRYPLPRVVEMIRTGEIQDAKTIAAVLMAVPRL